MLYQVDYLLGSVTPTPALTLAGIQIVSMSLNSNQAGSKDVTLDIGVKFGARVQPSNILEMVFSGGDYVRSDNGNPSCSILALSGSSENGKGCSTTSD